MVVVALLAIGVAAVSGGSSSDPRTPSGLPGLPPPFLATAVLGDGALTVGVDAYGNVVEMRRGPAGAALIENSAARQAIGTVSPDTGIVPHVSVDDGPPQPLWRADSVRQRYFKRSNVLSTEARFGRLRIRIQDAASGPALTRVIEVMGPAPLAGPAVVTVGVDDELDGELGCSERRHGNRLVLTCLAATHHSSSKTSALWRRRGATPGDGPASDGIVAAALRGDRRWLARARLLGPTAPAWATAMYERSLLVLRTFSDRRTGAVAAAARDGWAYVWPRDAATAALAFASAGYRDEARQVARFLLRLPLETAARFHGDGSPVEGREAQGDAWGWTVLAARATGLPHAAQSAGPPDAAQSAGPPHAAQATGHSSSDASWGSASSPPGFWRDRADYQEKSPGLFLGNALASFPHSVRDGHESISHGGPSPVDGPETGNIGRFAAHQRGRERIRRLFGAGGMLMREASPGSGVEARSGVDSAAAWAVRPFRRPALFPLARRSLRRLIAERRGRFGIVPSADWPEDDPWTAPTAAAAWAFAALAHEGVVVGPGDHGAIVKPGNRRNAAAGKRRTEGLRTKAGTRKGRAARDRRAALDLLTRLRRAATATGVLPERVDAETGVPRSATPLVWSHAFAVLALRELWPPRPEGRPSGPEGQPSGTGGQPPRPEGRPSGPEGQPGEPRR